MAHRGVDAYKVTMVPVTNGEILVRWYRKEGAASPGSAVVYYHGGGMVCGSVDLNDRLVSKYVEATVVPILSVDYRLAPEYPDTTLVGDGYAALAWFVQRADTFGVDKERIAVMGDSGGGGVAAGVAIAARDARTAVAKQILIYPMLDDRTVEPSNPIPRSSHSRRGPMTTTSPDGARCSARTGEARMSRRWQRRRG